MDRMDIDKIYIENVIKDNEENFNRYEEMMKKVEGSTAIYKGEPIPFLPIPKMYTENDLENFKRLSATMMSILRKVIDRFSVDEDLRKEFQFGELLEKMIMREHGYRAYVPMARIDIFYRGENEFKFCELNADGSSAMNEDRELSRIFKESGIFKNLPEGYEACEFELFQSWVQQCDSIYKEFGGVKKDGTTVAIVDWAGGGTINEFEIFRDTFISNGFDAFIADPRDIEFRDGSLFYEGKKIDIIYRRLVTREIIDRSGEIGDFIKGCLESDVCMIGPIKSQIIHNKKIFKVLHDPKTREYLSQEEMEFIQNHIPMTKYFEGERFDFEELCRDKDNLILKPCDLYASRGVYAGKDYTNEQWMEKLEECIDKDYLIQEYYSPHRCMLIEKNGERLVQEEFNNITGLYMYNEKLVGLYSRVGKNPIISGLHECYTLPTFIVKKKHM